MEHVYHLDDLDKKIINLVSKNARIPFLEVARECNVSGAAIHQRMQRLTEQGVLSGSQFMISPERVGYSTCAYIGVFLEKASMFKSVVTELQKITEIVECHYTTGNYAIFIKVYTKNNQHLKAILSDRLQTIDGISSTETYISLEEIFKRQIPLE